MKISLVTVSYNSARTIGATFQSVAAQNYSDLEYIVVDGASKDGTLEKVKEFPGLVTKLISEPDQGIYDAMNKGVMRSTGEVIGILNSDDFYMGTNVLNEVSEVFSSDPALDVVIGDVDFVDDNNLNKVVRTYSAGFFKPWMFRYGFMPPHPAIFIRKSAYDRVGLYKLGYRIAADFDFLVRLLWVDGARYRITGKHWVRMRTGGASTADWKSNLIISREMLTSLRENNIRSSMVMILMRLPVKIVRQVLSKN